MSKHDHPAPKAPCDHKDTLKFCAPCNVVECTACGFEWKAQSADAVAKISAWPCTRPHKDDPWRWPYRAVLNPQPNWTGDKTSWIESWPGQTFCKQDTEDGGVGGVQYTSGFVTLAHKDHS